MRKNVVLFAGFVPLPWFLFWTAVAAGLLPGYSSVSQHSSEILAHGGMSAACFRIAVMGAGAAFILFGAAVWRRSAIAVPLGAIAWVLFGVSMLSNGVWPMGSPMHGLYGLGMVNLIAPALSHLELSERLPGRRAYAATALVSVAGVVYLWMNLTGNDPGALRGLTQRIFSSISSAWPFLATYWLVSAERPARRWHGSTGDLDVV
ncbi:MAG: DUF998 domain-containing protein [Telluria sp.]